MMFPKFDQGWIALWTFKSQELVVVSHGQQQRVGNHEEDAELHKLGKCFEDFGLRRCRMSASQLVVNQACTLRRGNP